MNNYAKREFEFHGKGWGHEKWIVNNDKYCGKLLYFAKGRRCSAHYHLEKDETFWIHSGKLEIWFYDDAEELKTFIERHGKNSIYDKMEKIILKEGEAFHIPPGRVHMMYALRDTEMYEFSTTHREEDSYRLVKGD